MPLSLDGYLTKAEVSEKYGRSKRQLTRDLSAAIRIQDSELLDQCLLSTAEGPLLGTEVTLDLIDTLIEKKQVPTWYIKAAYAPVLSRVSKPKDGSGISQQHSKPKKVSTPDAGGPVSDNTLVAELQDRISELKKDKEHLEKDKENYLEIIESQNDQLATANERTRESNLLMNQVVGLLPPAIATIAPNTAPPQKPTREPDPAVDNVQVVVDTPAPQTTARPRKKAATAKRKSLVKKKATRKAASSPKSASKEKGFLETHLPTFFDRS